MRERKRYQKPDIKVICIRENSDIIQTSGEAPVLTEEFSNISGTSAQGVMSSINSYIRDLFNTQS